MTSIAQPDPASDPWLPLEAECADALALGRDVMDRLEAGTEATELAPLLTRQRDALDGLCRGIRAFDGRLPDGAQERRDALAGQLAELLRIDEHSRQLVNRRGVRLKSSRGARKAFTGSRKTA